MTPAATLGDVADTDPAPTSIPEPVFSWGLIVPIIVSVESTAVAFWVAFAHWRPTPEQTAALAGIQSPLVLIVGFLTLLKARNRVAPVETVALYKKDVALLDAAQGPPMFISPAKPAGGNPDA